MVVKVTIAADGTLMDAQMARSSGDPGYDVEALRMVRMMPWKPAMQNGKPIKSYQYLPVCICHDY